MAGRFLLVHRDTENDRLISVSSQRQRKRPIGIYKFIETPKTTDWFLLVHRDRKRSTFETEGVFFKLLFLKIQ